MAFLYGGFCIGLVYELLAILRRHAGGRPARGLCDAALLLFAIPCSALCFLIATGGVLRLYGFLLLLAGSLASRWTFQPLLHMI